jgi:hypothetical protein
MAFSKPKCLSTRIAQIGEWREENLKIREIRVPKPIVKSNNLSRAFWL